MDTTTTDNAQDYRQLAEARGRQIIRLQARVTELLRDIDWLEKGCSWRDTLIADIVKSTRTTPVEQHFRAF